MGNSIVYSCFVQSAVDFCFITRPQDIIVRLRQEGGIRSSTTAGDTRLKTIRNRTVYSCFVQSAVDFLWITRPQDISARLRQEEGIHSSTAASDIRLKTIGNSTVYSCFVQSAVALKLITRPLKMVVPTRQWLGQNRLLSKHFLLFLVCLNYDLVICCSSDW
jgi:hypothetical protein